MFDPSRKRSLEGNYYGFLIVDNYSKFTWTLLLIYKDETFEALVNFVKLFKNLFYLKVISFRSDHGGEFENHQFQNFCNKNGIAYNFLYRITPQQNDVV